MIVIIEELIDGIKEWLNDGIEKDNNIGVKIIGYISSFIIDLVYCISDIWNTLRDKNKKTREKIIDIVSDIFFWFT